MPRGKVAAFFYQVKLPLIRGGALFADHQLPVSVLDVGYACPETADNGREGELSMFCPQCGNESTTGQHYCRSCGANLKVIGKAVSLSDAISKTDGVPAKIKEIMSN